MLVSKNFKFKNNCTTAALQDLHCFQNVLGK